MSGIADDRVKNRLGREDMTAGMCQRAQGGVAIFVTPPSDAIGQQGDGVILVGRRYGCLVDTDRSFQPSKEKMVRSGSLQRFGKPIGGQGGEGGFREDGWIVRYILKPRMKIAEFLRNLGREPDADSEQLRGLDGEAAAAEQFRAARNHFEKSLLDIDDQESDGLHRFGIHGNGCFSRVRDKYVSGKTG